MMDSRKIRLLAFDIATKFQGEEKICVDFLQAISGMNAQQSAYLALNLACFLDDSKELHLRDRLSSEIDCQKEGK